ncbi:aldehyde:ferredoxin oxidoreductase [Candidatus Bathyarchaeota archaeon]|nr:aldehyde:ferredoxin oxidoreductase [Candidatus Bathyarchaeota archaeon]
MNGEHVLLRINLSDGTCNSKDIPLSTLREYIGGKGLGSRLLLDEIPPRCDPLGEKNKIIFVAGPLTGTSFPTANRYGILYKSPLTGTYAESYSGGGVAQKLRASGHFSVIIEGKASEPVQVHVREHDVKIKSAEALWGKDTLETCDVLGATTNRDLDVLTIGPAGENQVLIANVQNNKFHSAGRCGPGAVMGSKNLKAIIFSGNKRPALNKKAQFKTLVRDVLQRFRDNPLVYGREGVYRKLGTPVIVDWANKLGCFPTRYYTRGYSDGWESINADAIVSQILKRRVGCWNCPFTCGKLVEVSQGPFKCEIEGPEYETIANFGGLCDIRDIRAIAKINEYCDRMGIDTISAGSLCGLAIEAKRRELIPGLKDIEISYNAPLEVLNFLEMMVKKKGIGEEFSMGTGFLERKYKLKGLAMHVKGLEFAGYDPRAFRGFALSYGVAPEGPTHLRSVYHGIEKDLPNRTSYEGKVQPMIEQEDKMALIDSFIVCKFIRGILDWPLMARMYNIIFDASITVESLRAIAARMVTASRQFNYREGFTRDDDYLPERVYTEPLPRMDGTGDSHRLDKESYEKMLDEYYEARGWSSDGAPPAEPPRIGKQTDLTQPQGDSNR